MKKVISKAVIGVWMDHAEARIIDIGRKTGKISVIKSPSGKRRIAGEAADGTSLGNFRSTNNEYSKHNKKQNTTHSYFKKLADALGDYDEIHLFGPTTAQKEFHNFVSDEKLLTGKKITSQAADYLTDNQLVEHVRKYFSTEQQQ